MPFYIDFNYHTHACDICSNLLLPPAKQMINLEKVCVHSGGVHYGATLIVHSLDSVKSNDAILSHI
jgi:hypothetical protein